MAPRKTTLAKLSPRTVGDFLRNARRGDVLVIPLGKLGGPSRSEFHEIVQRFADKGVVIVDQGSGETITAAAVEAVIRALREKAGELRLGTPEQRAKRQAAAAKARRAKRMPIAEARRIWLDVARYPAAVDALTAMWGWSRPQAYDKFGPRTARVPRHQA